MDDAKVVKTDIQCDNGVIHVIDSVLLPSEATIPETAKAAGQVLDVVGCGHCSGISRSARWRRTVYCLAPTDEAFAKLPKGTVESLLKPENKAKLVDILKVPRGVGRVYSEQVLKSSSSRRCKVLLLHQRLRMALRRFKVLRFSRRYRCIEWSHSREQ